MLPLADSELRITGVFIQMVMDWEPAFVKEQLRLTSLRLGQLQEKKDSEASIIRRDIATLLHQQNVELARAKAQKLLQGEVMGDLLELLEMHVGLLLEHFQELNSDQRMSPGPNVVEAVSSIIFAAPHTESKDLHGIRKLLIQRFSPDFCQSTMANQDHVAASIIRAVSTPPPSAAALDAFLERAAHIHSVSWSPEPQRHDILNQISEILDPDSSPTVDISRLRKLCSRGLPDEPLWLRPRIWKLLFGVLPTVKASWQSELDKQRECYYDLVRRYLNPFSNLQPPSIPLMPVDVALLDASNQLSGVPSSLFSNLAREPDLSALCPLDDSARDDIRILCAHNLDTRLAAIRDRDRSVSLSPATPEIRLEPDELSQQKTTLLSSNSRTVGSAHEKHITGLLRLLYLHTSINSGNLSPYIASLLVPLYVVLNQEVEAEELAHVEADTFWVFEAMIGEFAELEDEEGGNVSMKNFSQRLAWADNDLFNDLQYKGLDPALPHYSYRWLAPLLTHTLPLQSVIVIWDTLFSLEMRQRGSHPKIDHLLDICTAMLIRVRTVLFRLGTSGRKSPSLWTEENSSAPSSTPLPAWKLGDAFIEGNSLLQGYPIEAIGGVDLILQTAFDLRRRREQHKNHAQEDKLSFGARLKVTMWKGFTNQVDASPTGSEEALDDSSDSMSEDIETSPLEPPPVTSQLASVWRGLTKQSTTEAPSSAAGTSAASASKSSSLPPNVNSEKSTKTSQISLNLWGYAEKLKDSDAVAAISKISSNWRAKALTSSWRPPNDSPQEISAQSKSFLSEPFDGPGGLTFKPRGGSLPPLDRSDVYSPPARPMYFRPPRDSVIFTGNPTLSPTAIPESPPSNVSRKENIRASLESLMQQSCAPVTRSGPRPLLLSPSTPITSPLARHGSPSSSSTPASIGEWSHVKRANGHNLHRDSQSSVSSLSPSDALSRAQKSGRSDWDSDSNPSSRRVPLNRKSVSPMAPVFRIYQGRSMSAASLTAPISGDGLSSPPSSTRSPGPLSQTDTQGPGRVGSPIFTSPISHHLMEIESQGHTNINVVQRPVVLDDIRSVEVSRKKVIRRTPSPQHQQGDTSDSSVVQAPARSPRLRSRRSTTRPPHLDINEDHTPRSRLPIERKLSNPNSLAVEWPTDDQDIVPTPRASAFDMDELSASSISLRSRRSRKTSTDTQTQERKVSAESHDVRMRKVSISQRMRKTSGDSKDVAKRTGDSSAEEGDDEGYDELLSAYESEEGPETTSWR